MAAFLKIGAFVVAEGVERLLAYYRDELDLAACA
jgi:hypothetical protein